MKKMKNMKIWKYEKYEKYVKYEKYEEHAGAELGQAQLKLGLGFTSIKWH